MNFEFRFDVPLVYCPELTDPDAFGLLQGTASASAENVLAWSVRTKADEGRPTPDWRSVLQPELSRVLNGYVASTQAQRIDKIRIQLIDQAECPPGVQFDLNEYFNVGFLKIPPYLQSLNLTKNLASSLPRMMRTDERMFFLSQDPVAGLGISFAADQSSFIIEFEAIWLGDSMSIAECEGQTEKLYEILCLLFFSFTTEKCQEAFGLERPSLEP